MPFSTPASRLLGGRLSLDFVNATPANAELPWERLIRFLESTGIVSAGRGAQLLSLPQSDPQAAEALLMKARRLGSALRKVFAAMLRKQRIAGEWIEPLNEILRITEGHDELVGQAGVWKIEFVAREGGLDWLTGRGGPLRGGDYRRGRPRAPSALRQSALRSILLR